MLILAIDCSTDILGLALFEDKKLIGEYNLSLERQHSEKLMPLMKEIFALLGYQPEELDGVAVSIGPGSFTGLRIGITAAKMLGRIFSIPVKGISSLEVMASAVDDDYILALLDAKRERVYYSFFNSSQNLEQKENFILNKIKAAAAAEIKKLPEILSDYKKDQITVLGQKRVEVIEKLEEKGFKIKKAALRQNTPRAAVLAELGLTYIKDGNTDDIYQLKPVYLKKPQAEINWQQKYGNYK